MSHSAPGGQQLSWGGSARPQEQLSQGILRKEKPRSGQLVCSGSARPTALGTAQLPHSSAIGQAVAVQDPGTARAGDSAACLPVGSPWHYLSFPRTRRELLDKTWSCSALSHTQPLLAQAPSGPSHPQCPQPSTVSPRLPLFLQGMARMPWCWQSQPLGGYHHSCRVWAVAGRVFLAVYLRAVAFPLALCCDPWSSRSGSASSLGSLGSEPFPVCSPVSLRPSYKHFPRLRPSEGPSSH